MPALIWDPIDRPFEEGIDKGVLYVDGVGYAWNGITSVTEKSDASINTSTFIDGTRYALPQGNEDFNFKLEAFTYPAQFAALEGLDGIFDKQPPKQFGLSYRVKYGTRHKIHLLYNVVATPSDRDWVSLGDQADPAAFSWDLSAVPTNTPGARPSAHLIIDTSLANAAAKDILEASLYGDAVLNPELPPAADIITLFQTYFTLNVTDNGDGTWTASGPDDMVYLTSPTSFEINSPSAVYTAVDSYRVSSI